MSGREVDDGRCEALDEEEAARWLDLIGDRFGIAREAFAPWRLIRQNRKLISLTNIDCVAPLWPPPLAVGLPFIHTNMAFPKLTTGAARLLGPLATRNVIVLTAPQADWYLRRVNQRVEPEQLADNTSKGYVLVMHAGFVLGVGLLRLQEDGSGWLESLYPKAHALAEHRTAFEKEP
jgi:hypothetical protein